MEEIRQCMAQLVQRFGGMKSAAAEPSWDCIVISAADEAQKNCFHEQINWKLENKELPGNVEYLVIADLPTSTALGSGGATFSILEKLHDMYQERLYSKKIWILHAGGFSKRLPNFSCTGKLFCPLPMRDEGHTLCMFNLKLLTTSPFLQLMQGGGVFISGCDDIETFSLDGLEALVPRMGDDGVVALAHPSTVKIGNTHGVYVLSAHPKTKTKCWLSTCQEVLQKPSYEIMNRRGALYSSSDGGEGVYTDSMFWLRPELVKKMVTFSRDFQALYGEETCIYGDFLACMGTRPAEEKLYWKEISAASPVKRHLAMHFQSTPLNIIVLEQSHFYHLGTMPEYIENLQPNSNLFQSLGMEAFVGSRRVNAAGMRGVVTNCLLEAAVQTEENTVMDDCVIKVPLFCEERTILSHCFIDDPVVDAIPSNWLFHTSAVVDDADVLYVTIAFQVDDDLKGDVRASLSWKDSPVCSASSSLWKARLFEAERTMGSSFTTTWKSVKGFRSEARGTARYSMEDIVRLKHTASMVAHRAAITQSVSAETSL